MFKAQFEITDLNLLENLINFLKNYINDKGFHKFLQEKVLKTLEKVMNERFGTNNTTNDDSIELYKSSNHIEETNDGFILYNDAQIPANTIYPFNYPNGMFNIALAFEYGVGIVGEGTYTNDKFTPWEYNINHYNFGWYYTDNEGVRHHTYGYMGYEIYRFTAIEIENNLFNWYIEYMKKVGM